MKVVLLIIAFFSTGLGNGISLQQLVHKIPEKFENILGISNGDGAIKAVCNEFGDKLFVNINTWAITHGYDHIPLANVSVEFLTAYIELWSGYLSGMTRVNRSNDIVLEYSHNTRTLNMDFPIVFNDLEFGYNYHVALLLVGPRGRLIGKIDSFPARLHIAFNFTNYQASLVKISTWGMGQIHIRFEDDPLIDLVADILAQLVVDVLHPAIEGVINEVIKIVAGKIVDGFNEEMYAFLHPNYSVNSMLIEDVIYKRVEQIKLNY